MIATAIFLAVRCTSALPGCKTLLLEDSRFAGCQQLLTGSSAVMWAANGSDAAIIKPMMTEGSDMGWMGLGWNMHGSMKGDHSEYLQHCSCCSRLLPAL